MSVSLIPVAGMPEVRPGDDLAEMISRHADLHAGDVVIVTQKVVSKAEGRLVEIDPEDPVSHKALVEAEAVRVLRRRGDLVMTETAHGFVCANSGVDLSNVERMGSSSARGPGPLGTMDQGRPARPHRRQGRGHRFRHLRADLEARRDRRRHRHGRRGGGRRPQGEHR